MNERGDHFGLPARHAGRDVAHQMDTAEMPSRPLHRLANRGLQAPVRIRDDQVHAARHAVLQDRDERGSEHGVLGAAHVHAEDLTFDVITDSRHR